MAEPQRRSWIQKHGRILLVLAGLLFVAGVTTALIGVADLAGARDDLTSAEAELEATEGQLAEAEQEAVAAEDRLQRAEARLSETTREARLVVGDLETAQPVAAGTLVVADEIAVAGRELCDCDEELSTLSAQSVQAAKDRRDREYNRLVDELNSWAERANTVQEKIDQAIPRIQQVTVAEAA